MSFGPILGDPHILIADDELANVTLLCKILGRGGYDHFTCVDTGSKALSTLAEKHTDLVLLDLHMPDLNGYDVLSEIRKSHQEVFLPVLVFTADATQEARKKALELGASDFLTKPGDVIEILLRVRNFLMMRAWHVELHERNMSLETKVRERTKDLERSQVEIIERLAHAGEYRDLDTGEHTQRVGDLSAKIAKELGHSQKSVQLIRLAGRLHDIGKIAVPDGILRKARKLTPEEYALVREHTTVGARILANGTTPLVQMAERIAESHHERFDGKGYPHGLVGDMIPIEARIVCVADTFDALTNERPYKNAWTIEDAVAEIVRESGLQFDPEVVEAFLRVIKEDYSLQS